MTAKISIKKSIISLYIFPPLVLFAGWGSVRDNAVIFIRQDAVELAIATALSALLLTIGFLINHLILMAKILKAGAIIYIFYIPFLLIFDSDWSDFSWSLTLLILLTIVFYSFPALVTYSIASSIIKDVNHQTENSL